MSGMQGLKNRIKSVNDTGKITSAMYLIASTKLQKAKRELDATRPYFEALKKGVRRLYVNVPETESPYFSSSTKLTAGPDDAYAILVITADKGLAGAYNQNIMKETIKLYEAHPKSKLFVLGEFGRRTLMTKGIPFDETFLYTAQRPTLKTAREITYKLLDLYNNQEVDRLYIVYTDMKTAMLEEAKVERMLPFCYEDDESEEDLRESSSNFDFIPSIEAVLESTMHSYITGYIYSALVDSFCSEQNARMSAMSAANDNAKNISAELQMLYNRMRQSDITNEIIEISAGAKAQEKNRTN